MHSLKLRKINKFKKVERKFFGFIRADEIRRSFRKTKVTNFTRTSAN